MLLRGAEGPKGNRATAKLGKPALQLRLRSVMRQTRHVQNLASLGKEGANIGACIHGTGQNVGVLLRGLRLANEASKDSRESNSLFHCSSRRGRGKSLQVEGQVVLDGSTSLNRLDLQSGADVRQHRGAEGERLRVVLLPSLVLGTQVEGARMLEVRRKDDSLVTGFSG